MSNKITLNEPTENEVKASIDPNAKETQIEETHSEQGDFTIPIEGEVIRPEKFKTEEDLIKAYLELEKKLTTNKNTPSKKEVTTTEDEDKSIVDMDLYVQEFANNGQISEDSYKSLEENGYSKELVDNYIEGRKSVELQKTNAVYGAVGGKNMFDQAVAWAVQTWDSNKIAAFNASVSTGDIDLAKFSAEALVSEFKSKGSFDPTLLESKPSPGGTREKITPYASQAQWLADMNKKEYQEDPDFRELVKLRLIISNV